MLSWRHVLFVISFIVIALGYPYSIVMGRNFFFGFLVLFYMVVQVLYAAMNYRSCSKLTLRSNPPSVALLIVGYRENETYWEKCLNSILETTYPNISGVMAFVDGCEEEDRYMADIFQKIMLEDNKFPNHVELLYHKGKRHALMRGYRYIMSHLPLNEYIIVVDSDTIIRPDAIGELVKCIDADDRNACATGNIQIFNRDTFLARIIHARYLFAFTVERSAQSHAGVMTCCSGPFSIFRQSFFDDELLEDFINEKFCGQLVHPGDDRALTCLLLERGHLSRQTPFAIVETETPDDLARYLKQQCRWSRSYCRECIKQVRAIGKHHLYLTMITIYEILFPFLVVASFLPTFQIIGSGGIVLMHRVVTALGVLLLRSFLLASFNQWDFRTCSWNVMVFPLYFIFLLPIKLYAWCTPHVQGWITSSRKTMLSNLNLDVFMIYSSVVAWNVLLLLCFYFRFSHQALYNP